MSTDVASQVATFHPMEPGAGDPADLYAAMRHGCPVARSEHSGGFWLFSRYEDMNELLRSPAISSRYVSVPPDPAQPRLVPLMYDPPEHTAYRHPMTPWFAPAAVARFEPGIRERAREAIGAYVAAGGGDFVEAVAVPFPCTSFLEFAGLPTTDLAPLLVWKDALFHDVYAADGFDSGHREETVAAMMGYFAGALADAAGDPARDDVVALIAHATAGDRPLTDEERLSAIVMIFMAGLDTTTSVLAHSVWFLATHDDHRRQLVDDPSIIPSAIEELLRYFGIVTSSRIVAAPTSVGGIDLRPGDMVMAPSLSSGRDETQFDRPDEVDFRRANNRHLAFGAGPHRCIGAHLARLELRVALEELLRAAPELRLDPGDDVVRRFGTVNGIDRLPLLVGAAPR